MGKYRVRSKYSRACKKAKSVGHFKTSFGGKHVRVTVGTKGIHPSIKFGKVTYKPLSGNYSIRGKYGTYYGNTKSFNKAHGGSVHHNNVYYSNVNANPVYHPNHDYYDESMIKAFDAIDATFDAIKNKEYYKFIVPIIFYILIPLIMIIASFAEMM